MKVQSDFEIKQFITYLNKFTNLSVINSTYSENRWKIKLNDNTLYSIDNNAWELIQSKVPRLSNKKVILHWFDIIVVQLIQVTTMKRLDNIRNFLDEERKEMSDGVLLYRYMIILGQLERGVREDDTMLINYINELEYRNIKY